MSIAQEISLDGTWELGPNREYGPGVQVPGLCGDPARMSSGVLWLRRRVELPAGAWTDATLVLKGARFCPSVYVNGEQVSQRQGGMAPTMHPLRSEAVRPGNTITLEIALDSLADMDAGDASRIPVADHWRSNISSCLWDSVKLRTHGRARIARVLPSVRGDELEVRWAAEGEGQLKAVATVLSDRGRAVAQGWARAGEACMVALPAGLERWRVHKPALHRLRLDLYSDGQMSDSAELRLGLREMRVVGKRFELDAEPVQLRAGTVVWPRWVRDAAGAEVGWDVEWFDRNVLRPLMERGANTIRFHLGSPPEALLDLCDERGMLVQIEWPFFHGMTGSYESLIEQWRAWLDLCVRHPCVVLIHPWNETDGEQLKTAFAAIETLSKEYPPLVISHRDVIHVHKYWWSLFENVGLYYDSAEQFPQPIMVDEFGGNYLDGDCEPGGYKTLSESLLRFLGRGHTKEQRLELHTLSNARVAEYWRRLGAAGFSPFCIAGSWEDGNHWYLGKLKEGRLKPVWDAMTAAWSPRSVSLEIWDRNFEPGEVVSMPLWLFNDTEEPAVLKAQVSAGDDAQMVESSLPAFGREVRQVSVRLPEREGRWDLRAELVSAVPGVEGPVVSAWPVRTLRVQNPPGLERLTIGVSAEERELRALLKGRAKVVDLDEPAQVVVLSRPTEASLTRGVRERLEKAIEQGTSVVMLDLGPQWMGENDLPLEKRNLQGQNVVPEPRAIEMELFAGVRVLFRELPEPESCIHRSTESEELWWSLHRDQTCLWNGHRGGLVVPSADMEVAGLSPKAVAALWIGRGAKRDFMQTPDYFAHELAGFYEFSEGQSPEAIGALRQRVKFLVDDAPALQHAINPEAPVRSTNLGELYRRCAGGRAQKLVALANCGKNLTRTPAVRIEFGAGRGRLVLSQLMTAGRLARGFGSDGLYGVRYDPAAAQVVLNMIGGAVA